MSNTKAENVENTIIDVVLPSSIVKFFNLRPAKFEEELEYIDTFFIRFLNIWGSILTIDNIHDVNDILVLTRFEIRNKDTYNKRIQCWLNQRMIKNIRFYGPKKSSLDQFQICLGQKIMPLQQQEYIETKEKEGEKNEEKKRTNRKWRSNWIWRLCCLGNFYLTNNLFHISS